MWAQAVTHRKCASPSVQPSSPPRPRRGPSPGFGGGSPRTRLRRYRSSTSLSRGWGQAFGRRRVGRTGNGKKDTFRVSDWFQLGARIPPRSVVGRQPLDESSDHSPPPPPPFSLSLSLSLSRGRVHTLRISTRRSHCKARVHVHMNCEFVLLCCTHRVRRA